jgi:ribosomal protein L29
MSTKKKNKLLQEYDKKSIQDLKLEVLKLKIQNITGSLKDTSLIKKLRKLIAKKLTFIRSNQINKNN